MNLGDVGQAYANYVELMAHFDEVLPGRVHHVIYENLVADPETEVRRLLDHMLPTTGARQGFAFLGLRRISFEAAPAGKPENPPR